MKILKWALFFLIAFTISFILLRTFSQDVFKHKAPAIILRYTAPAIPIYWYVAGSFVIGFLIGLAAVINNFITSTAGSFKKSKRIKELEKEVDFLSDHPAGITSQDESPPIEESVEEPPSEHLPEEEESEDADEKKSLNDNDIDSFIG